MKLIPATTELEKDILASLSKQFPAMNFVSVFEEFKLYTTPKNHIYLIPIHKVQEFQNFLNLESVLRHVGIYLGRMRNEFGLAFEALFLFQKYFSSLIANNQAIKLNSKQVKRFLYGTDVILMEDSIYNALNIKLFVFDEYNEIIGLGMLIKHGKELFLHPIVDLGMYIRLQEKKAFIK